MQQPIWKFLGNRFVETHIPSTAQVKDTELAEVCVSFAVPPSLLTLRSSTEPQFEIQRQFN
jgi:hypothetical protein